MNARVRYGVRCSRDTAGIIYRDSTLAIAFWHKRVLDHAWHSTYGCSHEVWARAFPIGEVS